MPVYNIGYEPHKHQFAIHSGMQRRRFGIAVAHRRFGKTWLGGASLIDAALRLPVNDGRFGYVAPFLKQAKDIAWPTLRQMAARVEGTQIYEGDLILKMPNQNRIRLYGADNYDAMRGGYFDGVLIDEGADIRAEVWFEVILPMLADRKGWALFIGTPKGLANLFYEIWQFASDNPEQWFRAMYRADETNLPWLQDEELALLRAAMPDAVYRQEFLCDFTASSSNILIPLDLVLAARKRELYEANMGHLPKVMGVDVARFGDDNSVIQKRWGLIAYEPIVLKGLDNMQLAARVAQEISDFNPQAVFIDGGRGEGVIDRLRQLGHVVMEINFGSSAINPGYINRRTEMWDLTREWIYEGAMLPANQDMLIDLTAPTYDFSPAGKMRLEEKDKIKERTRRSTDIGDALALTFAEPIAASPFAHLLPGAQSTGHSNTWDPGY